MTCKGIGYTIRSGSLNTYYTVLRGPNQKGDCKNYRIMPWTLNSYVSTSLHETIWFEQILIEITTEQATNTHTDRIALKSTLCYTGENHAQTAHPHIVNLREPDNKIQNRAMHDLISYSLKAGQSVRNTNHQNYFKTFKKEI